MNRLLLAMLVLLARGPSRGVAQDVRYDFDKDKDFSKYKTYKWAGVKDADRTDLRAKAQSAIDAELAPKGLTKTDSDEADLYIDYPTIIGSKKQYTSYNTSWVYGPEWGGGWLVYPGRLDLSMYDSHTKQLVWRGMASKTLDPNAKPEKKQENINKAVKELLKNCPPKPKQ